MMKPKNLLAISGVMLLIGALHGCGGGGNGGAFFPASVPTGGAGSSAPDANASVTDPAASAGTPSAPVSPIPLPPIDSGFIAVSAPGIALQAGLYAVSYGMGSANEQPDKSIWRTTLQRTDNNLQSPAHTVYAGNTALGKDVLEDGVRDVFDPNSSNGRSAVVSYSRLDDASGKLLAGAFSAQGFYSIVEWKLSVADSDLSGTSIQDFLVANRSLTKPIADLNVAGPFATGSKGTRFVYTATSDTFLFSSGSTFIQSQSEFERSTSCGEGGSAPTRLATKIAPGGTFSILEIAQGTSCTPAILAAGTVIGTGTWERKTGVSFDYVQLNYPASIPFSRFDSTFAQSDYDAGVQDVLAISNNGRWYQTYFVPEGVSIQSRNLALNKVAADSVRAATGM